MVKDNIWVTSTCDVESDTMIVPEGVTTYGDGWWWGYLGYMEIIKNVKLPKTLKKIHNHGFETYKNLEKIILPDALEEIGERAFYACESLKEIIIPDNVTKIGEFLFAGCCKNLEKVKLPKYLTTLPRALFMHCSSLKDVELPNSLKIIGPSVFWGCNSLSKINLPDSVEEIGSRAFLWCENITELTLPKNLKYIREGAFGCLKNLKTIVLPDSLEVIEKDAFHGCTSLTKIKIPRNVSEIQKDAFANCDNLEHIIIASSIKLPTDTIIDLCFLGNGSVQIYNELLFIENIKDKSEENIKIIKEKIIKIKEYELEVMRQNYSFNEIAWWPYLQSDGSFKESSIETYDGKYINPFDYRVNCNFEIEASGRKLIKFKSNAIQNDGAFAIPIKFASIGDEAFADNDMIKHVQFRDSVVEIGSKAFKNCKNLEAVLLTSQIKIIANDIFEGCDKLERLVIKFDPQNVPLDFLKSIPNLKYLFIDSINTCIIMEGVTEITNRVNYGFYSLDTLEKIVLPNSLKVIGAEAFYGELIDEIDIPKNVKAIGSKAFEVCKKLKEIELPDSVIEIGDCCFNKCYSLAKVKLPKNLEVLNKLVFADCLNLKDIIFSEELKEIGEKTFFYCRSLENIELPNKLTKIDNNAFNCCYNLKYIKIPKSVKVLGQKLFNECNSLNTIDIESSLNIELESLIDFISNNKNVDNIYVNGEIINKRLIKWDLIKIRKKEIKNLIISLAAQRDFILNNSEIESLMKKIKFNEDIEKQIVTITNEYIVTKQKSLKQIIERHKTFLDDKQKEDVLEELKKYNSKKIELNGDSLITLESNLYIYFDYISNMFIEVAYTINKDNEDITKIRNIIVKNNFIKVKQKMRIKKNYDFNNVNVLNIVDEFIDNKLRNNEDGIVKLLFLREFTKILIQKLKEELEFYKEYTDAKYNLNNDLNKMIILSKIDGLTNNIALMINQYHKVDTMLAVALIIKEKLKNIKHTILLNGLSNNNILDKTTTNNLLNDVCKLLNDMEKDINENNNADKQKVLK